VSALFDLRLVALAGAGSLLSLDRRAAVQAMLAHPVVAAVLAGWALGDLPVGLLVGVLLGLLWSGALPVGGVVPPDETLGAVVGVGVAVLGARAVGAEVLPAAMCGFLSGVPAALLGRRLELVLRRYNGELAARAEKAVAAGDTGAVERVTVQALVVAVAGAFIVHLLVLFPGVALVQWLLQRWPEATSFLAMAAFPVPLAGIGAVITGAGFRVGLAWATLGFGIGLLVDGIGR
jgi:mannose/fructose/N-acetylgalactosamine-specific phosphotransferase system component IIC